MWNYRLFPVECFAVMLFNVSLEYLRLKDCLPHCDSNVEELDVEWVNDLPVDILVEHAVHVWHITVRHQDRLLQEGRAY